MTMKHKYFKEISPPNNDLVICWDKSISLNNDEFSISLWAKTIDDLNNETLDKFATVCEKLAEYDERCRQDMIDELNKDNSYMTESLGEVQDEVDSPKLQQLIDQNASIKQFVTAMNLTSVSMWADTDGDFGKPIVSFDYMIDSEYSDEILCVRYGLSENLIHVAHES